MLLAYTTRKSTKVYSTKRTIFWDYVITRVTIHQKVRKKVNRGKHKKLTVGVVALRTTTPPPVATVGLINNIGNLSPNFKFKSFTHS
ncbi:hypothetical protein RIF29_08919 [Crotalaria pallida]|uniref:Uncharacterized protein n=1 Tax=Crotalaria pallida TaxID=3830 RepID=A0AAN9FRF6_CROPI